MSRFHTLARFAFRLLLVIGFCGCSIVAPRNVELPSNDPIYRQRLVIYSDFDLQRGHRLLEELVALEDVMESSLGLKQSVEPINIYLFKNEEDYNAYMREHHPEFPFRRAFFVKGDTELQVYAHWGDRIAEDLRHETAHGYLHSMHHNLPLWLDEGLAEYYEVTQGRHGLNWSHIRLLSERSEEEEWSPDLNRLETLNHPSEMTQLDYAEAWLWVHMLLEPPYRDLNIIQDQLARLSFDYNSSIYPHVRKHIPNPKDAVLAHLEKLVKAL